MIAARWLALCCALCVLPAAWGQVLTLRHADVAPAGSPAGAARPVALPHDWDGDFPGWSGTLDYRLRFAAPEGQRLLGVYVQRACSNLEVRINGELVGSGGRMEPPVARTCYHPHLFPVPRALLRAGDNALHIRVAGFAAGQVSARQRAGGLSAVSVGPMDDLQPTHDRQLFWNITAAQIIAATIGALGLAIVCLWTLRRRDAYLLYFGLFTVGWALISTRLFVRGVVLSNEATEVLICSVFPPVVACGLLFLLHLVGFRRRWIAWGLALQALLVPMALLAAAAHDLLAVATVVYDLLALEFLAVVGCFFVVSWRTHRQDFWLVGSVLLVALVLTGAEVALQNDLLALPRIHLIHFVMPMVFGVMGARLIQLFVRALREAETLNAQLEQRVAQKSDEIARTWEQVTRLRTEQAAQDERRRIASDLHDDLGAQLLTIAQASQRGVDSLRVAGMARVAMEEMRLSVRGLTAGATLTSEALADWRAETMTRLADAGLEGVWEAQEPPPGAILPARMHVQLTRILREAVSNAIRHSGGSRCTVRVSFPAGGLVLDVQDNGRGMPAGAGRQQGHGLLNIERRARNLGGDHRFDTNAGTRLVVRVPLPVTTANEETP